MNNITFDHTFIDSSSLDKEKIYLTHVPYDFLTDYDKQIRRLEFRIKVLQWLSLNP